MEINFYNRMTGSIEREKVYGHKMVEWLYQSNSGKAFSHLICHPAISRLYGALQDTKWSKVKIPSFIKDYNIMMDDFLPENQDPDDPYSNFNQFFIRKFKQGKRPYIEGPEEMAAFSEGRYFGFITTQNIAVPAKEVLIDPKDLLRNSTWERTFIDGPLLIARLCPVDYHRFHFPDDGIVIDDYRVEGALHSVSPIALKERKDILITNERHVTILDTKNFGKLAYIEIGAICVGKIVQSRPLEKGHSFKRGEEKGYFLFGGSTVLIIGEKNKWRPSQDILDHTQDGLETYLQRGTAVATKGKL